MAMSRPTAPRLSRCVTWVIMVGTTSTEPFPCDWSAQPVNQPETTYDPGHTKPSGLAPGLPCRHDDSTVGGHRHHRDRGGDVVAGVEQGESRRPARLVPQQPPPDELLAAHVCQ